MLEACVCFLKKRTVGVELTIQKCDTSSWRLIRFRLYNIIYIYIYILCKAQGGVVSYFLVPRKLQNYLRHIETETKYYLIRDSNA